MKTLLILLAVFGGAVSCKESSPKAIDEEPARVFSRRLQEEGELTFDCWNGKLQGVDSDYRLHFGEDTNVELEEHGYSGVERFKGAYLMEPGGRVTISFNNYRWKWPAMILRRDGADLLLFREDGVTGWPIYVTKATDPNSTRDGFWPFRAFGSKSQEAEQAEAPNRR